MTERLREQLSALADDELDHREVELLLRRYEADEGLRACWSNYHLIGETIRRGSPRANLQGLAERVRAALDGETAVGAAATADGHQRRLLKILRPIGAAAIAASVGVVAVMIVRGQAPRTALNAAPSEVVPPQSARTHGLINYHAVTGVRWDQGSPQVRRELNEYLLDHNQDVPALARQGMLPYIHMATFYASPQVVEPPPGEARRHSGEGDGG